jgi:chromosome segregation ATPase
MVTTGKNILSKIDGEAQSIRARITKLDEKTSEVKQTLETLHHQKTKIYFDLAKIHLPDVIHGREQSNLPHYTEQEIDSLMRARQNSLSILKNELHENQEHQKQIETERSAYLEALEQFDETIQAAEDTALKELGQEPQYQTMVQEIDTLESQIERIEGKLTVAQEDCEQKAIPYHADPLFMYLWKRGYGTNEYKAGVLSRTLDQWVSRVSDFEKARRNYYMLNKIPKKLEDFKTSLESDLLDTEQKIENLQNQKYKGKGIIDLQNRYDEQKTELEKIDASLKQFEEQHENILQEKQSFLNGNDEYYIEAIDVLKRIYKSTNLKTLRRNALMTSTHKDDALIRDLHDTERDIEHHEEQIDAFLKTIKEENRKLHQVQNVRRTFKNKNYDSNRVIFNNSNTFTILLGQFITGILTNTHFWSAVGRLCVEILDELDIIDDDMFKSRSRHRKRNWGHHRSSRRTRYNFPSPKSGRSSRGSGGFKTGGKF